MKPFKNTIVLLFVISTAKAADDIKSKETNFNIHDVMVENDQDPDSLEGIERWKYIDMNFNRNVDIVELYCNRSDEDLGAVSQLQVIMKNGLGRPNPAIHEKCGEAIDIKETDKEFNKTFECQKDTISGSNNYRYIFIYSPPKPSSGFFPYCTLKLKFYSTCRAGFYGYLCKKHCNCKDYKKCYCDGSCKFGCDEKYSGFSCDQKVSKKET